MTIRIQKILLPTDFSDLSATAVKYGCELAAKFGAELHLLHTLELHADSTPAFGLGLALPNYVSESKAAAEKSLAGVLDPKWSAGRTVIHAVLEGSPTAQIIRYSRQHDIDLIVLSTHGRTGLDKVLYGSVAEKILRKGTFPMLVVRTAIVPKTHSETVAIHRAGARALKSKMAATRK